MSEEQILDRMAQMIRVGFVNARQPEKMRVKVTLEDTTTSPLITDWLPVLCPRASQDMQYDLPDIGDQVLCLFLSYGLEQGFVVGAMYGKQTPPVQSGDKWHRTFSDGATLEYDRASHALNAVIPGTATIKCEGPITLEAPIIYARGTLVNTAKDGSPGKSVFSGGMEVQNGGVNVPDADVQASGVSLTSHKTEGVQAGNDTSSHPAGGSEESPGTATIGAGAMDVASVAASAAAKLSSLESEVNKSDFEIDKLIACMPNIAAAEAEKCNPDNKQGWLYLHDMFEKWLSGIANPDALNNKEPFWVDMDWALSYTRTNFAYQQLCSPPYLFSENGRKQLADILKRDCKLSATGERVWFDYTQTDWSHWKKDYFQQSKVEGMVAFPPDGLMAAMGNFHFRALAKGYTEPEDDGHLIVIRGVSIFIWDSFNFEGYADLGWWQCNPPKFNYDEFAGALELGNIDFRVFREKYGRGNDFLVLSMPQPIDPPVVFSYATEL